MTWNKPFEATMLDEEKDKIKWETFTVKINEQERLELNQWKKLIQQSKDSTALKQLARIGAKVLLEEKTKLILEVALNNYRKNKRMGVVDFD